MAVPGQLSPQPGEQMNPAEFCHKTSSLHTSRGCPGCQQPAGDELLHASSAGTWLSQEPHCTGKSALNSPLFKLHPPKGPSTAPKPTAGAQSTKTRGTYQLGALGKGVEFIQATLAGICELCHRGVLQGESTRINQHWIQGVITHSTELLRLEKAFQDIRPILSRLPAFHLPVSWELEGVKHIPATGFMDLMEFKYPRR